MRQILGDHIQDPEERKNFLCDNADAVEEIRYSKPFDDETMARLKTTLAENSVVINDIEESIREFKRQKSIIMDPLKNQNKELLGYIKAKAKSVTEKCYKIVDREEKMTGYYNAEGLLVEARRATRDELIQTNIFQATRTTSDKKDLKKAQ